MTEVLVLLSLTAAFVCAALFILGRLDLPQCTLRCGCGPRLPKLPREVSRA